MYIRNLKGCTLTNATLFTWWGQGDPEVHFTINGEVYAMRGASEDGVTTWLGGVKGNLHAIVGSPITKVEETVVNGMLTISLSTKKGVVRFGWWNTLVDLEKFPVCGKFVYVSE
jgi:ABC-type phosphonate transport system ATPase subunit